MSYPITDIGGIDGEVATTLKSVGIRTTDKLLEAARNREGPQGTGREDRLIDEKQFSAGPIMADRMRIQGRRRGICRAAAGRRRRYGQGTEVPQPGQPRQGDGRGQRQAQAGAGAAVRPGRRALDRARQEAAAQDHVLMPSAADVALTAAARLTPCRRPRKATAMSMSASRPRHADGVERAAPRAARRAAARAAVPS